MAHNFYNLMLIAAETGDRNENIETVEKLGEFINKYGFMIAFSAVVLVLAIIFILNYIHSTRKKTETETAIFNKEREASIEQNKKMFDLVTKVQTEQIVQLQQMTESLKDMNNTLREAQRQSDVLNNNFENIKNSILDCDANHKFIRSTLEDVLKYAKNADKNNNEILEKISVIENELKILIVEPTSSIDKIEK